MSNDSGGMRDKHAIARALEAPTKTPYRPPVLTLTDFLLARIAEAEAAADCYPDPPLPGPAAEAGAKRRIVEEHRCTRGTPEIPRCSACSAPGSITGSLWPCQTLRLLALPYLDHPDYREEWKP